MATLASGPAKAAALFLLLGALASAHATAGTRTYVGTNAANAYKHLVCVYSQGSITRQCPLTITGPQAAEGLPCYCGHSPKGIIRAVPLTLAPQP